MKAVLMELCQRFLAEFPTGPDALLHSDSIQAGEIGQSKAPLYSVLVRGSHADTEGPLAIVYITVPSLSVDDASLLAFATRRACANKAPFFVTWTLRDTALWKTPKPGVTPTRDALEKLRDYPDLFEISPADSQPISEPAKLSVLSRGRDILKDLERLLKDDTLDVVQIDATYFVGRLLDAVRSLLPLVSNTLQHRLESDVSFRTEIADWALKQTIAGSHSDPEYSTSIARQLTYRLLGKILFYQSLRRSARHLPKLDLRGVDSSQVLATLRSAFKQALKIDYHTVFEESIVDRIPWPSEASLILARLIDDLNDRDFAHLPQDVVGTVFERLIPPEERHSLGQYFTSENLCDLITAFCVRSSQDMVLDPTCGTGTFLIRAYDRLRCLGQRDHVALLSQIWGVDIAPFPAELATINLFRQRIAEHGNFPRILCRDFFQVSPGEHFPFPPPRMDMEHPETIEEPIPEFDAIVGNFPYLSADQIEKHEKGYLNFLRERLLDGWLDKYPQLFHFKNARAQADYENMIAMKQHGKSKREGLEYRLSTYADLYIHLFFHAARFLKPGGRMGIVTSNAWLDVNYGHDLQEFFLKFFKIVAILESRCEPWFTEASVNTVVTIVERCDSDKERDANLVRFVKVTKTLAEFIPGDPVTESISRWQHLHRMSQQVEHAGLKYNKTYPLGIVTEENEDYRVRILRQGEMKTEVERAGKTVKWGQYLRAPQSYFDILQRSKLCLLRDIANPKFGSKTRINEFFHVTPEVAAKYGIEDEYLHLLIKSPKDTGTITVDPADLNLRIFICRRDKRELRKLKHFGALKYIEWGETQSYEKGEFKGLPWPEGTWVKDRRPGWWALPNTEVNKGRIFFTQALGESHFNRFCPVDLVPDARLYYLEPIGKLSHEFVAACLNSSLCALTTEIAGRVTMGDGVLELKVEDARDYLLVPDVRGFSSNTTRKILNAFQPLLSRPIGSVFDEVKEPDRHLLDSAILEAIGLEPKKYLKPLYDGLCELVQERNTLGQMRSKARKVKARGDRAEKKIAEEVLDDILPQGPQRFPDDFLSMAAKRQLQAAIDLPESPLVFDNSPMMMGLYDKARTFNHPVKTPAEAKFLIYAQQAGQNVAQLPEKTVEISRTVTNYEKYLRELRKTLYEAYYRHTLNTRTADRLTQSAFDRFRLPSIEKR